MYGNAACPEFGHKALKRFVGKGFSVVQAGDAGSIVLLEFVALRGSRAADGFYRKEGEGSFGSGHADGAGLLKVAERHLRPTAVMLGLRPENPGCAVSSVGDAPLDSRDGARE